MTVLIIEICLSFLGLTHWIKKLIRFQREWKSGDAPMDEGWKWVWRRFLCGSALIFAIVVPLIVNTILWSELFYAAKRDPSAGGFGIVLIPVSIIIFIFGAPAAAIIGVLSSWFWVKQSSIIGATLFLMPAAALIVCLWAQIITAWP